MTPSVSHKPSILAVAWVIGAALGVELAQAGTSTELSRGWSLKSNNGLTNSGAVISQTGYNVSNWYPISVPSTVLAGLVANGVYTNIYFGNNLHLVPDLTTQNWWYRDEFTAPAAVPGQEYWLRFKGIAYRAQIWLNGVQIDPNAVGTMVEHEYNVTSGIHPGATNVLALLITPPSSAGNNLSFWYVDWNPKPPDMNAGLWGKVVLETAGPVRLRDPYAQTVLALPGTNSADLTVYVDAINGSANAVTGVLSGQITKPGYPSITFAQDVALNANERRELGFAPATFPQLRVTNPALWWPIHLGSPELYNLRLTFSVGNQQSDAKSVNFGIRQFSDYLTPSIYGSTYRGYRVNGQNVLIRGADYVWDMLMRWDTRINHSHVNYVSDMGLNTLRFEGILGNDEIYDLADEAGIMLMPGFVCCTYWASFSSWTAEDRQVANASLESQMRLMRSHPSALVWAYGSDELPPVDVLAGYHNIATNLHWQNPTLDNVASYNNGSGSVPKMNGPYVWEPPVYWYSDTANGGAFGFCAEQGGESVPPEESLRKFMAPADLWPIGAVYGYHAGASPFNNLNFYSPAVNSRYGTASNVTQYAERAQLLNYESARAQFEAYGANAYTVAQGTVYWMLNNGWPSVHWNLYDYYLKPGGSYFGTKKALEPVHILLDYNTRNVKVFNSTLIAATNFTAVAKVYNIPDLTLKHSNQVAMNFPANASTQVFGIPSITGLTPTYFIQLQLKDSASNLVSDNLYWCSTSPDQLGRKSTWYNTAVSSYADLGGLNSLAVNSNLTVSASTESSNGQETMTIAVSNASPVAVAFFVRAEVTAGLGGLEVLPITYTDNYLTLWPGERAALAAQYTTLDLGGQPAFLRVKGYNVPEFLASSVVVPPARLGIRFEGNNAVSVCWSSAANKMYQLEFSSNLASTSWTALGGPIPGNGSNNCVLDPWKTPSQKFYRVRELP